MTMVERLSRWRDEGVITPAQFEVLDSIVRKERFSVSLELNALLYVGVLSVAAGLLWTVRTHFANLGDSAVVLALSTIVAFCIQYCFSRARPYSPGHVESPTAIFDYVLYLGCLVFAIELAFIEMRFALLKDAWDTYVLFSAAIFFAAAYRFDNRFVLSLALSTLAAWFGIKLTQFGLGSSGSLRASALVYGALVAGTGIALQRLRIKLHFVETHLHVAATAAFFALTSGVTSGNTGFFYLFGLLTLAAISIAYGIRRREFAFVAYGAVYSYVGISLKLVQPLSITSAMAYGVVSGTAMLIAIVYVARRFGREE